MFGNGIRHNEIHRTEYSPFNTNNFCPLLFENNKNGGEAFCKVTTEAIVDDL